MALIGTISGSVGVGNSLISATAISGTLIVADSPGSVFPTLPADVKFFVSGVQGAIAASLPGVAVFGGDLRVSGSSYFTDIDVTGHSAVVVQPYGVSAGQTGEVRFKELAANGGNYTALKAADSIAENLYITLPNAAGSNGNVLQTNGSGVTSFVDASSVVTGALSLVSINASSDITGSRFTSNAAGSLAIGGGQIYLNGASSNRIDFSSLGTGDPAFNAPTAGTKVVLYPAAGASATDYALGISPATLWQSIPAADAGMMFKWFGGTTTLAALSGSGNMEISGDLAVNGGDITSTAAIFNLLNDTATTVNFAGGATAATNIGNASGIITLAGVVTASGDLAVNGGDITTTAATFNLVDSAATTVNFARAATGLTIGASTGVTTIQNVITASSGKIALTNEAGSSLTFPVGAGALGAPTFTNSSIGTRIRMYPSVGPAGADWAMGMESGAMWFGVPAATSASRFRWYGGTTEVANLTGDGVLTVAGVVSASGDLAVNGGDITTTFAGTFNLLNLTSSQALTVGGSAGTINIGSTSTATTNTNIQTATNSAAGTIKTINIGTQTAGAGQVYVNIGSTTARLGNARITLHNEVHLTSGTLVGSPGGINNELTLVSSGSAVIRLDTNNDGPGHRFEIRDWNNGTEFAVSETGDAEISGNLLITGSSLSTQTTTTFNLLTTALTGTLNVASLASIVNVGGSITTSSFVGDIGVVGRTNVSTVVEKLINSNGSTGVVAFDLGSQGIFYVNNPAGNITANFINVPTGTNRVITPTIILSQSATTARTITALQIDGAVQTINWANGVTPTVTGNRQEVFGFSLIRSGSGAAAVWKVLGQMSSYG